MQEQKDGIRMNRTQFGEELCRLVLGILGEDYWTEQSQVRKNNGVMKEVLYLRKKDSECIPCFYMDELYRSYCLGEKEEGLAEYLANIVLGECEAVKEQAKEYLKKEWMVDHLFLRLIHREKNREYLNNAVYKEFLDLAAVVYVLTEENENGVKSFLLPKHVWDSLELGTVESYFPRLLENTKRLFPENLLCMESLLQEDRGEGKVKHTIGLRRVLPEENLISQRLYMLSNQCKVNGATIVLYPDLLKQLGERFGGNYYVIPSSVHEVLLLKASEGDDVWHLNRLICEVNENQVAPEEILSDHVYLYSCKEGRLLGKTE